MKHSTEPLTDFSYRLAQSQRGGLYDPREEHDACGIGLTADINGRRSHQIVRDGCVILNNLAHRGAVGSDPDTGDGAGILLQIPDRFFRQRSSQIGRSLPKEGQYAVGMVFLPRQDSSKLFAVLEKTIEENGCTILGTRNVPNKPETVGITARLVCPDVKQIFIENPGLDELAFERKLYIIRRLTEKKVRQSGLTGWQEFYISSLSCRTLVYKGMMIAAQLTRFYPDLLEEDMESAIAVVHQRYSTNTFPNWTLAHPFRMMCHNGEINTIRGNVDRRCSAQEILNGLIHRNETVWGDSLEKILPIFNNLDDSDSALFDNMLELLALSGRSLAHSILMMIPEAWGEKYALGRDQRGFFEYHATFMEPWDGPAAMAFSDGRVAGSIVDRNGLRPARYSVTKEDRFLLSSEAGVLPIDPADIVQRGCVSPGKMILVDTVQKRIINNDEIKAKITRSRPYRRWVDANRIELSRPGAYYSGLPQTESVPVRNESEHTAADGHSLLSVQRNAGYTREELDLILRPMYETGAEAIGAMGYDAPPAVLSDKPQLLFDYFRQRFAQVTNPPIDPIREKLLMSLTSFIGPLGSPLTEFPSHAHCLKIKTPVLTPPDLQQIFEINDPDIKAVRIDTTFEKEDGTTPCTDANGESRFQRFASSMRQAMQRICSDAELAISDGAGILILSDKKADARRVAVPSLLVSSGLGRYLMSKGLRGKVGLILESAEPRQVHHFAMLITTGLDAVCPYLAMETIAAELLAGSGQQPVSVPGLQEAVKNYISAIDKGLLKIFSKMGISTIRSYRYTLSCEAVGLNREFVEEFFGPIPSRIGGLGFDDVAKETLLRHEDAYRIKRGGAEILDPGGEHRNRRNGPPHLWDAESIALMQFAVRNQDQKSYDAFAERINNQTGRHCTLRSLMDFRYDKCSSVPVEEVEPADQLVRRFMTGAMSFGALSREVHEAMAAAMNRIGSMSNSGEGGEDSARFVPVDGIDRNSATKQIASGRFGVTTEYLANAKELQIKMAQGAKPGEGGHLPGHKVNEEIGRIRHSTPGVSLISPPPHHDIYSIEDLAQLIFDLKNVNPEARVSVKLVSICGVGTIAAGVAKGKADMILISGGDGGTGASPLSSIKNAGVPWELGLAETQQTLVRNELRGRVRIQTDGQIRTGRDIAVAAMLGAEEFGFGTAALVSLGCVLMRKCNANICPVGIATQDARLRKNFGGAPEHLIRYFRFIAEELRLIMAKLGFRTFTEMVGRSDLLFQKQPSAADNWKIKTIDLSSVFVRPDVPETVAICCNEKQHLDGVTPLMKQIVEETKEAVNTGKPVAKSYKITNLDRSIGAAVSYSIVKKYGAAGLPEDTVKLSFEGTSGQSFGAFTAAGVTLHLTGEANDYVGKGLSGGKLIIQKSPDSPLDASQNVIAGKTLFYGATGGEAYINGRVGERFCVRNSGAVVVVEGVGDHGCEYMTGGCVAVLGPTGVNFAAGMSGGIAYVYDPDQQFDLRCNLEMVDLEPMFLENDISRLRKMIQKHFDYTGSTKAKELLENWERTKNLFVKVIPMEYRAALGLTNPVDLQSRKTTEQQVFQA
ncbi:MAG: glutamate synthase large subunit [Planctomycetaceae bacterium]|jgi:glutamate synthase domain-containing protein 2/glutamate synthase domain-containing protein 1/glutamate synthase domain-containing protein 3|nr:glutamate synthase large subunit [Planctomycetaceae bacterium]